MIRRSPEFLENAGRNPELPMIVVLPDGDWVVEQWLRILPNKRYVARVRQNGQVRLAKWFVGPRAAAKASAEAEAIERLTAGGVITPKLEAHRNQSDRLAWLMTEYLEGCQTLAERLDWKPAAETETDVGEPHANQAVATLADLHNRGLIHDDLHPGNILFYCNRCWVIDAADIRAESNAESLAANLGLFLSQLPERWWKALCQSYNQLAETPLEYAKVCAHAWRYKRKRAEDIAAKSVRDCSLFQVQKSASRFQVYWRDSSPGVLQLLQDLDGALMGSDMLKDGGSATVGRVHADGQDIVIKRYNIKSFGHWMKRFWRPTRAWSSWQSGLMLRVLGVRTPKPLAMVEERCGPFRKRGYLLVEANSGEDLLEVLPEGHFGDDEQLLLSVTNQMQHLLEIMARQQVSHGDFKATNFLWDGQLHLIDLDSVEWHSSANSWSRAAAKDKARLLRNWPEESPIGQAFKRILTQ